MRIIICAVEPSGDMLGADLIKALRQTQPNITFVGCGGPLMKAQGLKSLFSIDPFSVIGPIGALKALPAAQKAAKILAHSAAQDDVGLAVFIDAWSFSAMAAKEIKNTSPETKLVKYVAPQVWASRPERAKKAAELFDGMLCLFKFELPYFEGQNLPVVWVGHSGFQNAMQKIGDREAFRKAHCLGDSPVLAVLPGSRMSELKQLASIFGKTIELLVQRMPALRVVVPAAPSVAANIPTMTTSWLGDPIIINAEEKFNAFAAADAALAASGTVTTEIAIQGTPMVIGYKVDPMTSWWMHRVVTTPYAALLNNVAEQEIIPEFLQRRCQPELMATRLISIFEGGEEAKKQKTAFPGLLSDLTGSNEPAANKAAKAILEWV